MSTDLVFDGTKGAYAEGDACHPRSVYGESKLAAEQALFGADPRNLVIRTAAFFGPWDFHNFAWHTLQSLKRRERIEIRADVRALAAEGRLAGAPRVARRRPGHPGQESCRLRPGS